MIQSHCTKSDQIRPTFEPKDHNVLFGNKRRSDVIYISLKYNTKQNKNKRSLHALGDKPAQMVDFNVIIVQPVQLLSPLQLQCQIPKPIIN